MDTTRLSIDSLGESEVERLKESLKQKETIINEDALVIKALRQQVEDLKGDLEESERSQEVLCQQVDRLNKALEEKNQDFDAVSHSLDEVNTAYDNLSNRCEAKSNQVKQLFEDLKKTKKDLGRVQRENEEFQRLNKQLDVQLAMANTENDRLRRLEKSEIKIKEDLLSQKNNNTDHHHHYHHHHHQQQQNLRAIEYQLQSVSHAKAEAASALHFQMADEVGEIMDSSSALPMKLEAIAQSDIDCPEEFSNENNVQQEQFCPKHQLKIKEEPRVFDPVIEQKSRVARANELARRNKLTKPLLQTSYALELDTFDTTDLTEQEIKRGNVAKANRARTQQQAAPVVSTRSSRREQQQYDNCHYHQQQSQGIRQNLRSRVLVDRVNTTPPVAKRVYKKAEAWIV